MKLTLNLIDTMICHKHKCIFIHISKCAGTSVERAFGYYINTPGALAAHLGWDAKHKLYIQHATPQQLFDLNLINETQWDEYYKFIIYRNTWTKLHSDYYWVSKTNNIDDTFENFLAKKGGFKEVLNVKNRKYCGDHLYKQKDYFYINGNRIKYDLEIDFDYLEKGFKTLTDRLNLDPNFFSTKHNVGNYKQQHYSLFYTKKIIKIVKDLYQEDLNFFDFDYKQPKKISKLLKLKMLLNKI